MPGNLCSFIFKGGHVAAALSIAPLASARPANAASTLLKECLHASNPDERAEACTTVIGGTRDRPLIIRALTARGNALCATPERCAEAVPDFASVVKLEPKVAGYFDNFARALRAAERYDDAIAASRRAVELGPRAAFTYAGMASSQERAGKIPMRSPRSSAPLRSFRGHPTAWLRRDQ